MPVPLINIAKEQVQTYQPLLLAQLTWASDGFSLYLSSHNLSATTGGIAYGGNNYLPRILDEQITATQALSEQGISLTPTVTLKLADADSWLYTNVEAVRGFKGATLTLTFIYWNVGLNDFSPDSIVKFTGQCGPPQIDDKSLTITAVNKINLAPLNLPSITIQPYCPWIFPATLTLQQSSADGTNQQSVECPYNPAGTSNQLGNLNGTVPFTTCDKTKENCQARGMYTSDSSSRKTGSFGGIQWNPPSSTISRAYLTGLWEQVYNNSNEAKYGDLVALQYGEGWQTNCLVLNESNDANYTSMEVLLSYGKVDYIFKVLVNDIELPHIFGDSIYPGTPPDVTTTKDALRIGYWRGVNDGSILGQPNTQAGYNGLGDPYGSQAVIYIQVVNSIVQGGTIPNVQVLYRNAGMRVYSSPTAYTTGVTSNPVWHLLDELTWLNLEYEEIDIQSLINEAAYCDYAIPYISQYGVAGVHARFSSTLALRQRQDGATAVRGLLNSFRGILIPNYASGLLSLVIKKTLGDQQPAAMDGSNYNTAVASYDSTGVAKNGYVAYYFTEGTIAEDNQGQTTLKIAQDQMQSAPNKVGFTFQDSENTYSSDSISITLDDDIALIGMTMPGSIQVQGPNTYDQGQRLIANFFAEKMRGNNRIAMDGETIGDTGGTISVSFETSHRVIKLHVGDIVMLDAVKYGLSQQLMRVRQIQPNANFERTKLTLDFHNDAWYMDFFGQTGAPLWTSGYKSPGQGSVRALIASAAPFLSDIVNPEFDTGTAGKCLNEMALAPVQYSTVSGPSSARVIVTVAPPTNVFDQSLQPPFVPVQGLSSNTAGALPGGLTYYMQLVAISALGQSHASASTKVYVAAGTSTNTIGIANLYWGVNTTGFLLYAGVSPDQMYLQQGNYTTTGTSGQPSTITITGKLTQLGEMPDSMLGLIRFKAKPEYFPGVITALLGVPSLSSGVWTLPLDIAATLVSHSLIGRTLALVGRASAGSPDIYPMSLSVIDNVGNTLTVSADVLGLATFYSGDQITIRMQPSIGSDGGGNYIQDALLANPTNTTGLTDFVAEGWLTAGSATIGSAAGLVLRIIAGTGAGTTATIASSTPTKAYIVGNWVITPDSTSVFVIEHNAWFSTSDTSTISNNGTMGQIQCIIDASDWRGQCTLVQAVTVDINGNESSDFAAPVREAYLLATGGAGDIDVPPAPYVTVATDFRGNFVLSAMGFPTLTNTNTVGTITAELFTWDMSKSGPTYTLTANVSSSSATLPVAAFTSGSIFPNIGQILMVGAELVSVLAVPAVGATTISVIRGQLGTAAAAQTSGAGVFALDPQIAVFSFPELFFSQAASGNWSQAVPAPNTILAVLELRATNQIGTGEANQIVLTTVPSFGLATIPNAGLMAGIGGIADTFGIAGTLAIGSNLATPYQRDTITQPREIVMQVRVSPVGADIVANINVAGVLYATLTIAPAAYVAILEGPLRPFQSGASITVDLVSVGTTIPGSNLGITIWG